MAKESGRRVSGNQGIRGPGDQDISNKSEILNSKFETNSSIQIPNRIKSSARLQPDELVRPSEDTRYGEDKTLKRVQGDITQDMVEHGKGIGYRDYGFVAVDISDGNWTIAITTDFDRSTAYNNAHKILSSPTGDKVHFVYANEGWTLPAGIFYCYSQDSGRTFRLPEMIDSAGVYPALGLDPYGNPCASWVFGSGIYYTLRLGIIVFGRIIHQVIGRFIKVSILIRWGYGLMR